MLTPSIFRNDSIWNDLFDHAWFDDKDFKEIEKKLYGNRVKNMMNTDIKETDSSYELEMDLPGFKKDEISAEIENGYLTVSASKGLEHDENDASGGKYIHRERYAGSCRRSFYLGENIKQEDIKAKFEHGILKLSIAKKNQEEIKENKYIAIEG